jgi:hypothetical protein
MQVVIGHPFKKGDQSLMKKRLFIQDVQYLFYVPVMNGGRFFKDITGNLSIAKGHQNPTPYKGLGLKALRHRIEKSPLHGNGYSDFQAGQIVIIQFLDPCEWEILFIGIFLLVV